MIQALIPAVLAVLDKVLPDPQAAADAKLKALEMAQRGDLAAIDADVRLALGQMEVNKTEAGTDLFRGGWRPGAGWCCVAGLGYQYILQPVLPWIVSACGGSVPPLPPIDADSLMALLFGMLGLGGLRTAERIKGRA